MKFGLISSGYYKTLEPIFQPSLCGGERVITHGPQLTYPQGYIYTFVPRCCFDTTPDAIATDIASLLTNPPGLYNLQKENGKLQLKGGFGPFKRTDGLGSLETRLIWWVPVAIAALGELSFILRIFAVGAP